MPVRSRRQESTRDIRLQPGRGRLNTRAHESIRQDDSMVEADNVRMKDQGLARRAGTTKVGTFTVVDTGAADFSHASNPTILFNPPIVPKGGFFFYLSGTATRPSTGTAYLVSSPVTAKVYGPIEVTIDSTGVLKFMMRDQTNENEHAISSSVQTADAAFHALCVFDAVAATLTLYLNGEVEGSPLVVGAEQPMTDPGTSYHFGFSPSAGTEGFNGTLDAWCLGALRGVDLSGGLLAELRKHSLSEWRNPASRMILSCFDFNNLGVAPTTLTDRSRHKNDGVISGTLTATTEIAFSAKVGNKIELVQGPAGRMDNVVMIGGRLFYETIA